MHQLTGVSKDFKILKDASGQHACFTKVPQILSSSSFPLNEAELTNTPRESSLPPREKLAGFLRPPVRREKEMGKQWPLVIVESISRVRLFATPWHITPGFLSLSISWSLLKLMSIKSVMPSNHLVLYHPFLLPPLIFPSIRVFSNEVALRIKCSKYWSFSISPSSEYSGLISFRIDWSDLLAVQGTLKSLLQHHSSKASILWCSALFIVQLSYPYMTTGKTIALTRWIFVCKVMSLLFNTLSSMS